MSKKGKLKTDLGDSSDAVFSDEVNIIISNLNHNIGDFTGLPVATTVLVTDLKTYNDIRLAVYYKSQVDDTDAARTVVQKTVTKDGNWLNTFCDGNLSLLKKTGYPLQKEGESQGKLGVTVITVNTVPNTAFIEFFISHIKGYGIHYGIYYTEFTNPETDQSLWNFYYASQREGQIPKLKRNTKYKMVSVAMGTDNDLTFSDEVVITTL